MHKVVAQKLSLPNPFENQTLHSYRLVNFKALASPYFDEEDEARFQFWDISAKQIDLFSVCSPAEEQADD